MTESLRALLLPPLPFSLMLLLSACQFVLIEADHALLALQSQVVLLGEGDGCVEVAFHNHRVALPLLLAGIILLEHTTHNNTNFY
jgi:hypothetical protein